MDVLRRTTAIRFVKRATTTNVIIRLHAAGYDSAMFCFVFSAYLAAFMLDTGRKVRCNMKTIQMTTMALAGVCAVQVVMADCGACALSESKTDGKAVVCAAGTCQVCPAQVQSSVAAPVVAKEAVVNTEALAALLRAKAPMTVLDARTSKYDDGRRVPGAKALSPAAKDAEVTALLPDKKALVVTYCAGLKCPASHVLGEKLRSMGYVNVLEYHEGIEGWVAAGNVVEQAAK